MPQLTTKKIGLVDRYFQAFHVLKPSDSFILGIVLMSFVIFFVLFVIQQSLRGTNEIASVGGKYTEGIVGTPRFINPVLAVTRADKDLAALIYDGLMRLGENGKIVPNVAETITISDDGLTYNIILKHTVFFHDETPLTAKDVIFTIGRIQDPLINSPLRANFDEILVEEVGEYEINFILPEPYAPFIENLTFGILPQHIWKDAGVDEFPFSQYNSEPVGSGPYAVSDIILNTSGIPRTYFLTAHQSYHAGSPKIETIELQFFPTDDKLIEAFKKGIIDGFVGVDSDKISDSEINEKKHHLIRIPLPRTFALFINQNKSQPLRDIAARKALDSAIDRTLLVNTVLNGYGNALTTPVPPGFGITQQDSTQEEKSIDIARSILRDGGWKLNAETGIWEKEIDDKITPLAFKIATGNNSTFEETAEFIRHVWEQLGADVTIQQFEQSDLTQSIIRPRDYETLLFGTHVGRPLDYYSFWHSSQRNDPGLNVSLYANITTDSILSEVRRNTNLEEKIDGIEKFIEEISKETPAIFLFAPELLYVFPNHIFGTTFTGISEPSERFSEINRWYIETDSVWPFFVH